jgi:hypothetical protein
MNSGSYSACVTGAKIDAGCQRVGLTDARMILGTKMVIAR